MIKPKNVYVEAQNAITYMKTVVGLLGLEDPQLDKELTIMEERLDTLLHPDFDDYDMLEIMLAEVLTVRHLFTNRLHEVNVYSL